MSRFDPHKRNRCGDCQVLEGELHLPGCDAERCPSCGGQRITCECRYLTVRERIPWWSEPNFCVRCGELWPLLFMEDDWSRVVIRKTATGEISVKIGKERLCGLHGR